MNGLCPNFYNKTKFLEHFFEHSGNNQQTLELALTLPKTILKKSIPYSIQLIFKYGWDLDAEWLKFCLFAILLIFWRLLTSKSLSF